jgi:hypothetical protein
VLCELTLTDAAYPNYPPQPIVRCDGHRPKNDLDDGEPGNRREDHRRSG